MGVVPGAVSHDAPRGLVFAKLTDGIERSTEFERTKFLVILALEKKVATGKFIEHPAGHDGSSTRNTGNSLCRGVNISGSDGSWHQLPAWRTAS